MAIGSAPVNDEQVQERISKGRRYTLRLYKVGPNRDQPEAEQETIQAAHLRHLFDLREQGIVLLNGPILDDPVLKGISIFDSTDLDEVKRLSEMDPAVQAGRLVYEIYAWFGLPGDGLPFDHSPS